MSSARMSSPPLYILPRSWHKRVAFPGTFLAGPFSLPLEFQGDPTLCIIQTEEAPGGGRGPPDTRRRLRCEDRFPRPYLAPVTPGCRA